jgi:hypothetical protein
MSRTASGESPAVIMRKSLRASRDSRNSGLRLTCERMAGSGLLGTSGARRQTRTAGAPWVRERSEHGVVVVVDRAALPQARRQLEEEKLVRPDIAGTAGAGRGRSRTGMHEIVS